MVDDADATMGISVLGNATLVDIVLGIGVLCNYFYNFIVRVPLREERLIRVALQD
jgi:hypothetical protein